jgi:hypothetical protein
MYAIFIVVQLTACSTEENFGGPATGTMSIASLTWAAPSEREDNTPISLSEIAGYRIYYGTAPGDYQYEIEINDAYNDVVDISLLQGTYYAVITTVDVDGRESVFSEEVILYV